jgi:hypothetical protein
MDWMQPGAFLPVLSQHFALFARDTLPLLIAVTLATLLVCILEARFGVAPLDFVPIGEM